MSQHHLILLIGLSACFGIASSTSAQAAKRAVTLPTYPINRIVTFKAKHTPVYSYPRAKHPHSKYLGEARHTTSQWSILKVIHVRGKRYVKITPDYQIPLQHGSVAPVSHPASPLDGGYVLFSRLKVHRKISKMPAITKTAYWLPTTDDDFWKMPEGTLGSNRAIHYGRTYAYRTIYAVQTLTTMKRQRYLYFETASGKKIGWLPVHAVVKGTFPNVLRRELTRNFDTTDTTTTTTTIDQHVRVGVTVRDGRTQRVVLADQNSETTIFDWQDGRVKTRTQRQANGRFIKVKRFKSAPKKLIFQVDANYELYHPSYKVTVTPQGAVSVKTLGIGTV